MPTTRRPVNRYAQRGIRLTATVREILLLGWSAPVPPDGDRDELFEEFTLSDRDLATLWRDHRPALLAEWQRRGGDGPTWGSQVFEGCEGPYCLFPTTGSTVQ